MRTRGRGGSWLQAKRRGRPGPAIRPARRPTRLWRPALTRCCTPTSSGSARPQSIPRSRAGLLGGLGDVACRGDAVASLDSTRAAYLLADAVAAFWPAWDTESNVELARAARDAAGDSDDPLFDYVLGFELARQGSMAESARLLEAAERAIVDDPARRDDPRALMLAADCAWWRSGPRRSCALLARAVDRARELGLAGVVAQALVDLADVQIDVGAWDDADAGLAEAIRLGEDTGQLTSVGIGSQPAGRDRGAARRCGRLRGAERRRRAVRRDGRTDPHSSATRAVCSRSVRDTPRSRSQAGSQRRATRSNSSPQTHST